MSDKEHQELKLDGIGASPGICIGKVYMVDKEGVDIVRTYFVPKKKVKEEVNRFKMAVLRAREEIGDIIQNADSDLQQHTTILETHMVLLKDKMLYGKTIEMIKNEQVNAEWALKKTISIIKSMFQEMADPYLKERSDDITNVGDRIMVHLVGAQQVDIGRIHKRVILVSKDLSPADTSQIDLERIKGFATDRGGQASHTGIIARTLEIPAVLGLKNVTKHVKTDDLIILDGNEGTLILNPQERTLVKYELRQVRYERHMARLTRASHRPAYTKDGYYLRVMGNIELPEEVVSVRDHGGEGIGLYRTEFEYLNRPDFPSEDELYDSYKDVIDVIDPEPVTIRTLDINGDKAVGALSNTDEINPALGLRAIRYCLRKPSIFKTQLRAILRAAVHGHVRILIPMISSCEELYETRKMIDIAADSLAEEGVPFNREVEIGIMVEVPAAVTLLDLMADDVDFFSIGTNDLIQYSLAIDRGNPQVAHLYNPLHPAILRMLNYISHVSKENNVKLYMCGEMASDPLYVPVMLALGMDEISMNPQSIPAVKRMIQSVDVENATKCFKNMLRLKTTAETTEMMEENYRSIITKHIYSV